MGDRAAPSGSRRRGIGPIGRAQFSLQELAVFLPGQPLDKIDAARALESGQSFGAVSGLGLDALFAEAMLPSPPGRADSGTKLRRSYLHSPMTPRSATLAIIMLTAHAADLPACAGLLCPARATRGL